VSAVTDRRDLRAELIGAAVTMLAETQAITVPSLRSIARECGVAPSAVYWHFPSEADLREAVLDIQYTDLIEAVEKALDGAAAGPAALIAAATAYVCWGLAHPGAYQLLFESNAPVPPTRAMNGPRLQRDFIALLQHIDPHVSLAEALEFWALQHGLVSLRLHKAEWDWGASAEEAIARATNGFIAGRLGHHTAAHR
jgi:AcrR family transcriptional regulator